MPEGKLYLVGLGPGDPDLIAPAALRVLKECDVVLGYRGYIAQISELIEGKQTISMDIGEEIERANKATELAMEGKTVALVSSGDAGIYGMAGPVFQVISKGDRSGERIQVEVIPGISAIQSVASLLGSPLMQDFCSISLSDLLTPWATIRKRVEMAALGDFVIALYNPKSRTRTWQLAEVREVLLNHRRKDTPVGIVRNAYRPDQSSILTTLDGLIEHYDSVDMFTTVIIGNSTTYTHDGKMITPRGYERKTSDAKTSDANNED